MRYDAIVKESGLEAKDEGVIYNAVQILLEECRKAVRENEGSRKSPIISFSGVNGINATSLLQRVEEMECLNKKMKNLNVRESLFRFSVPLKSAGKWSVPWVAKDDAMLLVGIYRYGFANWAKIQQDAELGFEHKFFLTSVAGSTAPKEASAEPEIPKDPADEVKRDLGADDASSASATVASNTPAAFTPVASTTLAASTPDAPSPAVPTPDAPTPAATVPVAPFATQTTDVSKDLLPKSINLVRRAEYLLKTLRDQESKSKNRRLSASDERTPVKKQKVATVTKSAPKQNTPATDTSATKKKKVVQPADKSGGSGEKPSDAVKELMKPVAEFLQALAKQKKSTDIKAKLMAVKKSVVPIGDRITKILDKKQGSGRDREQLEHRLWRYVQHFWPQDSDVNTMKQVYNKVSAAREKTTQDKTPSGSAASSPAPAVVRRVNDEEKVEVKKEDSPLSKDGAARREDRDKMPSPKREALTKSPSPKREVLMAVDKKPSPIQAAAPVKSPVRTTAPMKSPAHTDAPMKSPVKANASKIPGQELPPGLSPTKRTTSASSMSPTRSHVVESLKRRMEEEEPVDYSKKPKT